MDTNDTQTKNLYKWKKHDSKLNSKIKESDNIQNIHQWLRKVEDASETAINHVLNPKAVPSHQAHLINDDPFSEAHSLINQWVTDKIRLDMDDDIYNYVNLDEMNTFENNQKVLDQIKAEIMNDEADSILDINGFDYDKYDENYIASDLINKMMKKKFVDPVKLMKTDERKVKQIDYQLKIEMRHQAVKENREKRMREMEQKRKERLEKKEIELKAKQIVQKEEQDKQARLKIEQQLIEQEAQRLRIQMAEQRKNDEEMRKKYQEMEIIRKERERQDMLNLKKKINLSNIESEIEAKKNLLAEKRAEDLVATYLKAKNLRKMQRIFSCWYGLVLENRLKIGKAKALADWKLSYKVFNSWKKISTIEKIKKDQEVHQNLVKIENIKNVKALNHYHSNLIKKCFETWQKHIRIEILTKETENEKLKTKAKMQSFLEAAAEGKLQTKLENLPLSSRSNKSASAKNSLRRSKSFENEKSIKNSSRSKQNLSSRPKISYIETDDDEDEELVKAKQTKKEMDLEKKVKELMLPWMKSSPIVNNFDNRFKAQEKLLHDQHKMIKEQQKIIEDMKFRQNQVAFKEQIALLEQIKSKQLELEKMQKQQYQQEKKLLRQKAIAIKNKPKKEDIKKEIEEEQDSNRLKDQSTTSLNNLPNQTITSSRRNDQFMKNMEERAQQREQMKREREEKKRKQELEKLEVMKKQQEEKLRLEEEEKRKKQDELKDKRKQQKELEEKRNSEKILEQTNNSKADLFYKKYLMRYYCINGFKKLIEIRESNLMKAIQHYNHKVLRSIVKEWRISVYIDLKEKYAKANDFNNKRIVRNCFKYGLKQFKQCIQIETAKANRFYKYRIKMKLFEAWKIYKENEKEKYVSYEILIEEHNLNRIKIKYFKMWKDFPNEQKKLKQRQKRLDELRSKVKEIIPDFQS